MREGDRVPGPRGGWVRMRGPGGAAGVSMGCRAQLTTVGQPVPEFQDRWSSPSWAVPFKFAS